MAATNQRKAPEDSNGWLLEYACRLILSGSQQFSEEYVWDVLPMVKGWCYYNWLIENDPMNRFGGVRRTSKGYCGLEAEKLIEEAHIAWGMKD